MKESTKRNLIIGFGVFGITTGVLGLTGVGICMRRTNTMKQIIAGSAERIKDLSHVDIDHRMVESMIQKSVREQAGTVARDAADKIRHEVESDLKNRVKQVIGNQTAEINKQVAKAVSDEMAKVNRDDIIEDVVAQTTEKLVDKLSEELDAEVGRIGKIYKGIAAALQ